MSLPELLKDLQEQPGHELKPSVSTCSDTCRQTSIGENPTAPKYRLFAVLNNQPFLAFVQCHSLSRLQSVVALQRAESKWVQKAGRCSYGKWWWCQLDTQHWLNMAKRQTTTSHARGSCWFLATLKSTWKFLDEVWDLPAPWEAVGPALPKARPMSSMCQLVHLIFHVPKM